LQVSLAQTRINGLVAEAHAKLDQLDRLAEQANLLAASAHERALKYADDASAQVDTAAEQLVTLVQNALSDASRSFAELNSFAERLGMDAQERADAAIANTVADIRSYASQVAERAAHLCIEADEIARLAENGQCTQKAKA